MRRREPRARAALHQPLARLDVGDGQRGRDDAWAALAAAEVRQHAAKTTAPKRRRRCRSSSAATAHDEGNEGTELGLRR